MGQNIVSGDEAAFGEEHDAPMKAGAAFEQAFSQASNAQAEVEMRLAEAVVKSAEGLGNEVAVRSAEFRGGPAKSGMKVDPHSLPVKGLVRRDNLADLTSVLTAL